MPVFAPLRRGRIEIGARCRGIFRPVEMRGVERCIASAKPLRRAPVELAAAALEQSLVRRLVNEGVRKQQLFAMSVQQRARKERLLVLWKFAVAQSGTLFVGMSFRIGQRSLQAPDDGKRRAA